MLGKARLISARIVSRRPVGAVTGSNPTPTPCPQRRQVQKNGRIASPETVASLSTKAAKSMAVMERTCPVKIARQRRRPPIEVCARGNLAASKTLCHPDRRRPVRAGNSNRPMNIPAGAPWVAPPSPWSAPGGDLPGQPVPAQFGRRHRAGTCRRNRLTGPKSACRVLSSSRSRPRRSRSALALDRYRPKRCMLVCAAFARFGTMVFATATTPAAWSPRVS